MKAASARHVVMIVVSDPARGVLFYPTKLALGLARAGEDVRALTWTTSGQQAGLADELMSAGILLKIEPALRFSGVQALTSWRPLNSSAFRSDLSITFGPVSAAQIAMLGYKARRRLCFVESMGSVGRSRVAVRAGGVLLNMSCDDVFALCEIERARLLAAGVAENRVQVCFNPVDCDALLRTKHAAITRGRSAVLESFGLNAARSYAMCFANLNPGKRHDILLDAFNAVRDARPDVDLLLCGSGPMEASIRAHIVRSELESRVKLLGRLDNQRSIELMQFARVIVQASEGETFGYSLIEPVLFGLPLVTTRVGVALELERAGLAVVVDRNNVEALAAALRNELQSDSVGPRAGEAERFVRERCDIPVVVNRLLSVAQSAA